MTQYFHSRHQASSLHCLNDHFPKACPNIAKWVWNHELLHSWTDDKPQIPGQIWQSEPHMQKICLQFALGCCTHLDSPQNQTRHRIPTLHAQSMKMAASGTDELMLRLWMGTIFSAVYIVTSAYWRCADGLKRQHCWVNRMASRQTTSWRFRQTSHNPFILWLSFQLLLADVLTMWPEIG